MSFLTSSFSPSFQPPNVGPADLDLSAGLVAVIGSSAAAMASLQTLRSTGVNVRWYCRDLDVAATVLLASGPPGRLELSFADPLQADYRDFIAVVAGDGSALDRAVAARARAQDVPINIAGQPMLSSFALPRAEPWFGARRRKAAAREIAA
jgi:siroheme synthase (precorrin-2 oxidase/ferrochelatase)